MQPEENKAMGYAFENKELKSMVEKILRKEDHSPVLLNLVAGAVSAHEHAFHHPNLSKEDFLKWMGEAWDAGHWQGKVSRGEEEGSINNSYGIAGNLAANLAMFGKESGVLPKG